MGTNKVTYNPPKYAGFLARSSRNTKAMKQGARENARQGPLVNNLLDKM